MAKTKKTKIVETPVDFNEIEILTWEQIKELFDVTQNKIQKHLINSNDTENFWYPYENKFSEEDTIKITALFRAKFPNTEILDKHGPKYTEIQLSNMNKHQFMYSLIKHFKK